MASKSCECLWLSLVFVCDALTRRLGDTHAETQSARESLAQNLRVQQREDEAAEILRVRSWTKHVPNWCGIGTKRPLDGHQ